MTEVDLQKLDCEALIAHQLPEAAGHGAPVATRTMVEALKLAAQTDARDVAALSCCAA